MEPNDRLIVSSLGFCRENDGIWEAIIRFHIGDSVIEVVSEETFGSKEKTIEYLKENISPLTELLCTKLGLEVTSATITKHCRIQ